MALLGVLLHWTLHKLLFGLMAHHTLVVYCLYSTYSAVACSCMRVRAGGVPGPEWWQELVARVMRIDNSWDKAAGEYMNLYNSIRVR